MSCQVLHQTLDNRVVFESDEIIFELLFSSSTNSVNFGYFFFLDSESVRQKDQGRRYLIPGFHRSRAARDPHHSQQLLRNFVRPRSKHEVYRNFPRCLQKWRVVHGSNPALQSSCFSSSSDPIGHWIHERRYFKDFDVA